MANPLGLIFTIEVDGSQQLHSRRDNFGKRPNFVMRVGCGLI